MKLNKINRLLLIVITGYVLNSCHTLDLEPKGFLGEDQLYGNTGGIESLFAGFYNYLPIEDFLYMVGDNNFGYRRKNSDQSPDPWGTWGMLKSSLQGSCAEFINGWRFVDNDGHEYWPYDRIREVNNFIEKFPEYKNNYTEPVYNSIMGEAHFFRAFYYSGMAKRYGGVPIIDYLQDPKDDLENLKVPRNTEYETWKFIYEDLKFAMENMQGETLGKSRANKYTAAALMSRMMLFAGSVAKYTQYLGHEDEATQKKLAGIDPQYAAEFFEYALEAGKMIAESGKYSLYGFGETDPNKQAQNFANLFLDQSSPETIFSKDYNKSWDQPRNTFLLCHTWDALTAPVPDMSSFVGANAYPALDFMTLFDFPDLVDRDPASKYNGQPRRYIGKDAGGIKDEIEPRLRGCVYFNGDQLRGATFDIRRGLYKTYNWQANKHGEGFLDNTDPPNAGGNRITSNDRLARYAYITGSDTIKTDGTVLPREDRNILILGRHGMKANGDGGGNSENNCLTGAYVRKYVNPELSTKDCIEHSSTQPWIVFRLGEVYMNIAEAAYELGDKETAFEYIRKIRQRAGCKNINIPDNQTDVGHRRYGFPAGVVDSTLQCIRDERYRELWGENHRWFDLRRWRTAVEVLKDYTPRILSCYVILDETLALRRAGNYTDFVYIYVNEREMYNRTWRADKRCYYQGLPAGQINSNPKLLPNNPLR